MAVLKVHGSPFSTASMRVFVALYEKDLEFEFILVDMKSGEHKSEPYLSHNPFGQVPALEDGDLELFESRAITRYIADEYADKGNQLICHGKSMATVSVWMEVEAHQYDPAASKLVFELGIKPILGIPTDQAMVDVYEAELAKVLDVYEARLSKSKYLGCECYTLADMHHLPTLNYLMDTEIKKLFEERPHVSAWVSDITARPAWCKVIEMKNQK